MTHTEWLIPWGFDLCLSLLLPVKVKVKEHLRINQRAEEKEKHPFEETVTAFTVAFTALRITSDPTHAFKNTSTCLSFTISHEFFRNSPENPASDIWHLHQIMQMTAVEPCPLWDIKDMLIGRLTLKMQIPKRTSQL